MTHKSSHIIINIASEDEINGLPQDKQEKIHDILDKANKEVDKVLDKNPNLD